MLAAPAPRPFGCRLALNGAQILRVKHVRSLHHEACLVCGNLRFAQRRTLGRRVSDEFTVPLCRGHHREIRRCGDEASWWAKAEIDATAAARALRLKTHPLPTRSDRTNGEDAALAMAFN
jgi:hypothetical protein